MAAESNRTLIHYSKCQIMTLENGGTLQQDKLLTTTGKPSGFWYAYDTDWKNKINSGNVKRSMANTTCRYEFTLPESAFVDNIDNATPDTIFELSSQNLDTFMTRFMNDKYIYPIKDIIESLIKQPKSVILRELRNSNVDENGKLIYDMKDGKFNGIKPKEGHLTTIKNKFSKLSAFLPSRDAQMKDKFITFKWHDFWEDVSDKIGGIEFHPDIFMIDTWNGLWLPWTSKLDIRSGIIFKPSIFRDNGNGGILTQQLHTQLGMNGGKTIRQSRRKKVVMRKTKRNIRRRN